MKGKRVTWEGFSGAAFILAFIALLAMRLEIFSSPGARSPAKDAPKIEGRESWRIVSQEGKRIGYARRSLQKTPGGYTGREVVFLKLKILGSSQELSTDLEAALNADLTLASFTYRINSGIFQFQVQGLVEEGRLNLLTGPPGALRKSVVSLKERPHVPLGLTEMLSRIPLTEGEGRAFELFDPISLAPRPVQATFLGEEKIRISGRQYEARKFALSMAGIKQTAWIGKEGEVLKESGLLGIEIELAEKEEVLRAIPELAPGGDLALAASVPVSGTIDQPELLHRITVRLVNLPQDKLFLAGGRQTKDGEMITITKEALPQGKIPEGRLDRGLLPYLAATGQIQSDEKKIKTALEGIVSRGDSPPVKAKKIIGWVYGNVEKRPVLSVPSALETLNHRIGDCNEHAVLVAALGRAAGIPTGIESGLVYQKGRFYYHAWNVFYLGEWTTADATLNQMPADVTHIRFVRGEGPEQIDLLQGLGKLKIDIIEAAR